MIKVLANDGISDLGKAKLEAAGFAVTTTKIPQDELTSQLNDYRAVLVRSATQIRKAHIDASPNLEFIGRGGVGMDNIDVDYALNKGLTVENTPSASSQSVAELVLAHLFTGARFLHDSNRHMPLKGGTDFASLKKSYSKGIELRGKNLGIVGFGRIGQALGRMGLGLGMNLIAYSLHHNKVKLEIDFFKIKDASVNIKLQTDTLEDLLAHSDFISVHVPALDKPVIGKAEFDKMKDGVMVINTSRGGVIDEEALLAALDSGKVAFAGLDVFENEPMPRKELLEHPNVSLTPHIGGSTEEGQERVWEEMAEKLIAHFHPEMA